MNTPITDDGSNNIEVSMARLSLMPGETLVIKSERILTAEQRMRITHHVAKYVPAGTPILILDSGLDMLVMFQPDEVH